MEVESLRKIVQLYENKRILWDSKHPDYYNKCKKADAWRQISQQVNIPVKDLKKKLQSLMGSFRREKSRVKKRQVAGSGGDDVSYTSKWFGYTWFQFLNDKDIPRNEIDYDSPQQVFDSSSNENSEDGLTSHSFSSDIVQNPPTIFQTRTPNDSEAVPSTSGTNTARTHRKPIKRTREDITLVNAYNILKKTSEASYDHYESFGNHVVNELRKYDPKILPYVKKALLDVLFQADVGQFDQIHQEYYSSDYKSTSHASPPASFSTTTQSDSVLLSAATTNPSKYEQQPD